MPKSARRLALTAAVGVVTTLAVATGATPALARPLECGGSVHGAELDRCIATLRSEADSAGKRAEQADEAYLQAKAASKRATARLAAAGAAADRARRVATRSRTRAGLVAANLARGGGSFGSTAQVLLSGQRADRVLYHLSRMSELGTDSTTLSDQAARDQRTAAAAEAQRARAADQLAGSEHAAKIAYRAAKRSADHARALVVQAEAKRGVDAPQVKGQTVDLPADASIGERVVAFARAQIGEPYVFGAAGPGSWDCSGLSMMAFQSVHRSIGGHSSNAQYHLAASKGLLVPYGDAKPGDLVFYGSGDMYHVAIYSGHGNMVEAPHPGASVREVPVRDGDRAAMVARFTG